MDVEAFKLDGVFDGYCHSSFFGRTVRLKDVGKLAVLESRWFVGSKVSFLEAHHIAVEFFGFLPRHLPFMGAI